MSDGFVDAVRRDINLLILLAGGTGSGKTESAMRLAAGLAGGQKFAVIDTENGRALHKADDYAFKYLALEDPFTPERCTEAIKKADAAGFPVIVFDSGSAEYEGIGGVLDLQTAEFERMGSKEGARLASWVAPKNRHKGFVQALTSTRAHVILCLRAQDQIELVKVNGKTEVRQKQSLIGAEGWVPIVEKRLPFEATISLLLLQSNPGIPVPIKLERRHEDLISTTAQLDEATGERLAAWAKGSGAEPIVGANRGTDEPTTQAPSAPDESGASHPDADVAANETTDVLPSDAPVPTYEENIAALNALVGQLREAGEITTRQLWVKVARMRKTPVDDLIDLYDGVGEDGELHWSPLRQIIRPEEAVEMRKGLGKLWAEKQAGVAA